MRIRAGVLTAAFVTAASLPAAPQTHALGDLPPSLRPQPQGNHRHLICPAGHACVCLEPLPCAVKGDCPRFDDNVAAFRAALAADLAKQKRTVQCRRAEIGACGPFRYFQFSGDGHRNELRLFAADGRLVFQRNASDHDAYCDKRTRLVLQGPIPKCTEMKPTELICGKAEVPLLPPWRQLLALDKQRR